MGKTIITAALALVLGLFLGGIGPRSQLRRSERDLEQARTASRDDRAAALPIALGLGSLVAAKGRAPAAAPPRFVVADGGAVTTPAGDARPRERGHFPGHDELGTLRTASQVRAAQFRSALFEAGRFNDEARTRFDAEVKTMNDELAKAAGELAAAMADHPKVTPRDMADVGARVLDIYRRADDHFKAGLDDAGKAAVASTDFDLITQIDAGAFETLADTLGGRPIARPGREEP